MHRRELLAGAAALAAMPASRAASAAGPRTLRTAFDFGETGFDPVPVSDLSSNTIIAHIFEPPLTYDYLARPAKLKALTAVALPEVSSDWRRLVFTIRPGILFADDPVFGGRPRELTAADYVYSLKRHYDPALLGENLYILESARLPGLSELRQAAIKNRTPFPYDVEVAGVRALDRYRFEVRTGVTDPRFVHNFTSATIAGALAREVVEAHGADIAAHPVGTGPFVLESWRRRSRIVLARNPRFREQAFDAEPPPGDADAVAMAARLKGRRLPMLDRVEVSVIDEAQPRWLAFLNGELDVLELPPEFAPIALPGGRLASKLVARGIGLRKVLNAETHHTYFNFLDPMVGGYAPENVALRRAVAMAYDNDVANKQVYRGLAVPAQSMIAPQTYGYDPAFACDLGRGDAARANALLDVYGYVDRNGDGWRERPDGKPLQLRMADSDNQLARQRNEMWRRCMDTIGVRMSFENANFGELIKRSMASQLMMWGYAWSAVVPDGDFFLGLTYGPNAYQSNDSRFQLPAYDRLYERQRAMPDGAERLALMREAVKLQLAYVPNMPHRHRILADLVHPGVSGYLRHPFTRDWWRYTEVG